MNPSDQARQVGVVDSWLGQTLSSGAVTNPANDTIIADTGALTAGFYDVYYVLTHDMALNGWGVVFEYRNAANDVALWFDCFFGAAGTSKRFCLKGIKVAAAERFRFLVRYDITGHIGASIWVVKRA